MSKTEATSNSIWSQHWMMIKKDRFENSYWRQTRELFGQLAAQSYDFLDPLKGGDPLVTVRSHPGRGTSYVNIQHDVLNQIRARLHNPQ